MLLLNPFDNFFIDYSIQPFAKTIVAPYRQYHPKKMSSSVTFPNKAVIEKMDWDRYSHLKSLQGIHHIPNKTYKTAYSPSIEVLDTRDQTIRSVNGVGIVVKSDKEKTKWNHQKIPDKHYYSLKNYEQRKKLSFEDVYHRVPNHYSTSSSLGSGDYGRSSGKNVIRDQIRGAYQKKVPKQLKESFNIKKNPIPMNKNPIYQLNTSNRQHKLVTWRPNLQRRNKEWLG